MLSNKAKHKLKREKIMINLNNCKIGEIQFFDCSQQCQTSEHESILIRAYSANIEITDGDNSFIVQLSGNDNEAHAPSIPDSNECFYNSEEVQDWACENISIDDIESLLTKCGIENNFNFLSENSDIKF